MISPHPYKNRLLSSKLLKLYKSFPVVAVTGARQVGKSTLLEHTFPDVKRVVFDPIIDVENAKSDPDVFLSNRKPPLILDEIQYVPELIPAIKRRLEIDRSAGQFIVTGSHQWEVMKSLSESLAGRVVFLDLTGFNLLEVAEESESVSWLKFYLENSDKIAPSDINHHLNLPFTLFEQLWRGFLPEATFLEPDLITDYYTSYIRTYVERDIRQMAEISDLMQFGRFFKLCSALTAREINYSQLGRDIGVSPHTANKWLDLLKASFQWIEIPPYHGKNVIKRISNKPKGYLTDTGLVCYSLAIPKAPLINSHPLWGAIFETAVVNEIYKSCKSLSIQTNFYHWRSHGGAEVDLILEWNGRFFPIEIKGKSHPGLKDALGITAFKNTYPKLPIAKGLIIAPALTSYRLTDDILVLPWDAAMLPN